MDEQAYAEIRRALINELEASRESYKFKVRGREKHGHNWKIKIDPSGSDQKGLDESYESSTAWWPGPPRGAADVLSIVPHAAEIHLRYATGTPPGRGDSLWLYPPVYLKPLELLWNDRAHAREALRWIDEMAERCQRDASQIPPITPFDELRDKQREAFGLLGQKTGFLWGPPGTGKTYTLGRLVARCIHSHATKKVLLLSTTNGAVDLALVAVDEALEVFEGADEAASLRSSCNRLGSHFLASNYANRRHLLPVNDQNLLRELVELEKRKPDQEDIQAYGDWTDQVEDCRRRIRRQSKRVLESSRLAAMTTTRAVYTYAELQAAGGFDLLIFDEASQVPLAHLLALTPLAKQVLIAGDPKQLAPIARSQGDSVQRWIGTSAFRYMNDGGNTVALDEQSRMASPICTLVGNVFYKGKLRVAVDALERDEWTRERELPHIQQLENRAIHVHRAPENGVYSRYRYGGYVRLCTANTIRDMLSHVLVDTAPEDVLVLTPFRAQCRLIRAVLRNHMTGGAERQRQAREVKVSTVHRAQGDESHTVFFDPVKGSTPFLTTDNAERLVNVALSRAKARLVLFLSEGDLGNPLLNRINRVLASTGKAEEEYVPVARFIEQSSFPRGTIGKLVRVGKRIGEVLRIEGDRLMLLDHTDGIERTFYFDQMVRAFLESEPSVIAPESAYEKEPPQSADVLFSEYSAGERCFRFAKLRGADLSNACLSGSDLCGADLNGANLHFADLDKDFDDGGALSSNLSEACLRGADLSHARLDTATLTRSKLTGANLKWAKLNGATLIGADLSGADLNNATLIDANLIGADLSGANLSLADLGGASLVLAKIEEADMDGAQYSSTTTFPTGFEPDAAGMKKTVETAGELVRRLADGESDFSFSELVEFDLADAELAGINLMNSAFHKANLKSANLYHANLYGSHLVEANLRNANLCEAFLREAVLRMADLSNTFCGFANFDGSVLINANLNGANLGDAIGLGAAKLSGAVYDDATKFPHGFDPKEAGMVKSIGSSEELIRRYASGERCFLFADLSMATLDGVDLQSAELTMANLRAASLAGANLAGAVLRDANLTGAYLDGARLSGADLESARLTGADLVGADLKGAQLYEADLSGADLSKTNLNEASLWLFDSMDPLYDDETIFPEGFVPRSLKRD